MPRNMPNGGARVWYFPDGYLPKKRGRGSLEAHEALMLLNVGRTAAKVKLDFYFEDRPPATDIAVCVPAARVICLRLDKPAQIGGVRLAPLTQYAIRVRSNRPIVATFGRLDTTQANLAYYSPPCFWEAR